MNPATQHPSPAEPPHACGECGLKFFYAPELHHCRTTPVVRGESWVTECMRKQYAVKS
jgi:hypothetical protein